MIPAFPKFKPIELSDKASIEKYTKQFPPYSDFNFVSMWSWDIKGEVHISELNGNLVVRFTDYITGEAFYSFLGNTQVNETVQTLLDFSKAEGLGAVLKLVPEDSIKELDTATFDLVEDPDHHDYIIPTKLLCEYNTPKTKSRKKAIKSFLSKFTPEIKILDLSNIETQKEIFYLITDKSIEDTTTIQNEFLAISRFITGHRELEIIPMGIYVNGALVGFHFGELLNDGYANGHFWRADTKVSPSIYAYLLQEKAKLLSEKGAQFINIEQDLGLENLRKWKQSYGVAQYLKKYIVSCR